MDLHYSTMLRSFTLSMCALFSYSPPQHNQVASLIGADAKEIIFTSGATESNNLSLKGVAGFYKDKKRHIITTQTEHKCVLDSAR